jgi:hypothetical protein
MTSPIYTDLLQAKMLRGIRASIASDGNLLAFFGAEGIALISYEQLEHTIKPPLLAVVSGQGTPGSRFSQQANFTYKVPIITFIPRQTPVNPAVPTPAPPTVTPVAAGPLTGTFSYRSTFWGDAGESWASDATTVTLSGQSAAIGFGTIPSGVKGARLWRTADARSAYRYDETIQPDQLSSGWVDGLADSMLGDELAPISLFVENLKDYLRGVLYAHEQITDDDGVSLCDSALILGDRIDVIDRTRNLRIVGMLAQFSTIYSVVTMQSTADEAP